MAEPVLFTELVLPKGDKGDPGEPGPPGPNTVPTSEAIAAALTTPGAPRTALDMAIAGSIEQRAQLLSGVLELQSLWISGHSWQAVDTNATPGTRWFERLRSRFRMASSVTNKAVSGRTIGDISNLTLGGANAWIARTKALVGITCTINDITIFDGSAASLRGYRHAWRAFLAQVTANGIVAANTTSFVFSSGWTSETVSGTSSSPQGATENSTGGGRWKTTTTGAYFEFTFSGSDVDVFLVARAAGAGIVEFKEGSTVLGTLDLTQATAQDCAAIFRIRGRAAGTHTIRGTLTSGASLTVDSYRIPSTAPVPVVVLGEPEVVPSPTDHSSYVADVETFKTELATICAEFPSVIYVDLQQADWDKVTMLVTDSNGGHKHPNDKGCAFIATKVSAALAEHLDFLTGLNITTSPTGYPAAYVAPSGPSIPSGGNDGTGTGVITPALPSDFASRYRASSIASADGTVITSWSDEGAAGVAFTATNGPTYRTSPARLEFDASNDAMSRSAMGASRLVVCRIRTLVAGGTQIVMAANAGSTQIVGKSSAGNWILNNGTALDSGIVATTDWVVLGAVFAGASSILTVNGAPATIGDAGSNAAPTSNYLARATTSAFYAVDIEEVISYDRVMTASELRAAALQLKVDYGI